MPDVRVVTYDARGHGRSSCLPLPTATLAQLGGDLHLVTHAVAHASLRSIGFRASIGAQHRLATLTALAGVLGQVLDGPAPVVR